MQPNATLSKIGVILMFAAVGDFVQIAGIPTSAILFVVGALLYIIF